MPRKARNVVLTHISDLKCWLIDVYGYSLKRNRTDCPSSPVQDVI